MDLFRISYPTHLLLVDSTIVTSSLNCVKCGFVGVIVILMSSSTAFLSDSFTPARLLLYRYCCDERYFTNVPFFLPLLFPDKMYCFFAAAWTSSVCDVAHPAALVTNH